MGNCVNAFSKWLLTVAAILFSVCVAGASESVPIPVPKNVIYAGQVIDARLLRDRTVPASYLNRVSVFTAHSQVAGMIAKTTLLPNRPIFTNHVAEPNVVEVHRRTLMRLENGRLKITAEVSPLNAARVGELVRARNVQTGIIVYGIANKDGTITAELVQ